MYDGWYFEWDIGIPNREEGLMSENAAKCCVCGKELERDSDEPSVIYGGVQLQTTAATGSRLYDALRPSCPLLRTIICDECFTARRGYFWELPEANLPAGGALYSDGNLTTNLTLPDMRKDN